MKKLILLVIFGFAGCVSTKMEVLNYDNRCEKFVREETVGPKFSAFDNSLRRVEPKYPLEAARSRMEGYVVMVFDITQEGKTDNIEVIKSYPSDVFEIEAKRALSQWVYQPAEKDGVSVRSICHELTLEFKLG